MQLWLVNTKHPDYDHTCGAVSAVPREVDSVSPLNVVQAVLRGVTPAERAHGMRDVFGYSELLSTAHGRLGDYLTGVRIEGKTAVISFTGPAMRWLDSTACMQEGVKIPIAETLSHVFGVDDIEYEIDGVIVTEWDD